jgi:hypothetical protein
MYFGGIFLHLASVLSAVFILMVLLILAQLHRQQVSLV